MTPVKLIFSFDDRIGQRVTISKSYKERARLYIIVSVFYFKQASNPPNIVQTALLSNVIINRVKILLNMISNTAAKKKVVCGITHTALL